MANPLAMLFPPWRFGSNTRSAEEKAVDSLSEGAVVAEWCFAALVIFGVAGEFVIAFRHPPTESWLGWWGPAYADLLVAIGVAGEVAASMISHVCQSELTRRSKALLAEAVKVAAEAIVRAEEAKLEAAEAQLALEKYKAPRELTREQRGRIVDKLKQFSGTEFDITISDSDPEILWFAFLVELVLSAAGWIEIDWEGTGERLIRGGGQPLIRLGVSVHNVTIGVCTDQPPKLFEFALALCETLVAEGISATSQRHIRHEMSSTNANAIHIMIGRKTEEADRSEQA